MGKRSFYIFIIYLEATNHGDKIKNKEDRENVEMLDTTSENP